MTAAGRLLVAALVGVPTAAAAAVFLNAVAPAPPAPTWAAVGYAIAGAILGRRLAWAGGRLGPPGRPPSATAVLRRAVGVAAGMTGASAVAAFAYIPLAPVLGPLGAAVAAGLVPVAGALLIGPAPADPPVRRGRRLLTLASARSAVGPLGTGEAGLPWGGLTLPPAAAAAHFCVAGTTGSGKTLTLRLLMQAVLPGVAPGSGRRAVVYDPKQDALPLLAGMGLARHCRLIHPLDARGEAWDLAADCTTPVTALQIASVLIPVEDGPNRFFSDAARDLLAGVLVALGQLAPGRWTLRDVLSVLADPARLARVLRLCPHTADRLHYFAEPRTFQGVYATLAARLAWFRPVAACWDRSPRAVGLTRWVAEGGILVLGNDDACRTAVDAVNRAVFQRLTELLLGRPEQAGVSTWVFLDEVREAGKLDGLGRLLTKGRSKGVAVVLGFQAVEGMRDVYGDRLADELVGQCGNKAVLRVESPATADWAAALFGDQEVYDRLHGESAAGLGVPTASVSDAPSRRPAVLPAEFFDLPRPGPRAGLAGYYLSPAVGAYRGRQPWAEVAARLRPPAAGVPGYVPRPDADQFLRPWGPDDWDRLGLPRDDDDPSPAPALKILGRGPS